jgi:hypothetical protein
VQPHRVGGSSDILSPKKESYRCLTPQSHDFREEQPKHKGKKKETKKQAESEKRRERRRKERILSTPI